MSNVTELKRSPNTVVADMRRLADSIEAGEVQADSAVVILATAADDRPPTSAVAGAPVSRFRLAGIVTAFLHNLLGTTGA